MWTRRPIVKVAMGCRTEPAAVHIAHVLQRLDFFQFFNFFYNLHDLQQKKKIHDLPQKLKNSFFFYNSHDSQQKKNYTHLQHKKKLHDYTVFLYTTYIFHLVYTAILRSAPYYNSVGCLLTHLLGGTDTVGSGISGFDSGFHLVLSSVACVSGHFVAVCLDAVCVQQSNGASWGNPQASLCIHDPFLESCFTHVSCPPPPPTV